ncbi:transposase family protein [Tardiphaga sp. 1201_B9_N1_1]|uniref:transposase family protein n=1 Tax=unclassified Tardiphaga TaxID=2631404 RepID=UPI003F270041
MAELFDHPEWQTDSRVRTRSGRREVVIAATYARKPERCPKCGERGALRGHGGKLTTFKDLPADDGMPVRIEVARRRYRCISCSETTLQPLPDMDEMHRTTHRLIRFVEKEAVRQPLTSLAPLIGVHEKTVRRVVKHYVPGLRSGRLLKRGLIAELPIWELVEPKVFSPRRIVLARRRAFKRVKPKPAA